MDRCSASRKRKRKQESYQQRNQRRKRNRSIRKLELLLRTTYESILPDEKYRKRSEKMIKKVHNAITSKIEGSEVVVYGSQDYDVALSGSDVDFCVRMRDADFFEARTKAWRKKARKDISQISHILDDIDIRNEGAINLERHQILSLHMKTMKKYHKYLTCIATKEIDSVLPRPKEVYRLV